MSSHEQNSLNAMNDNSMVGTTISKDAQAKAGSRPGPNDIQNAKRALSWNSRPGVVASVMLPNCGVFTKRFGVPQFE